MTLIPFLKAAQEHLKFKYKNIAADAGYESEENYLFLKANGQFSYIKSANYEISKTRKYRSDIGKTENMDYDPESDTYTCKNGRKLNADHIRRSKSKGTSNVLAESTLLAMARNVNKLHNKIQKGRTGIHLFPLKSA